MKLTSAQAAKLLRQLKDELNTLETHEANSSTFLASTTEDPEELRPAYDYAATQEQIIALEQKIRRIKHTLNIFNSTTVIPEFGITIDEMLVYLPQLTYRLSKLGKMKDAMPRAREYQGYSGSSSGIIDYRYANYDIEAVKADYLKLFDEISRAQTALDLVNSTVQMEIDL